MNDLALQARHADNTPTVSGLRICLPTVLVALLLPLPVVAQQRPLVTQEVEIVEPGELLVQFGFDFEQGARFPLSGLSGDLTRVGVVGLHFGVSRAVELQVAGTIRNFLSVSEQRPAFVTPTLSRGGTSTDDTGDFTVAAKVKLFSERGQRPAMGFRFGYEMPNSNEQRGIGLNTSNVFGVFLIQKHFGRVNTFANVGLGILQAPAALFTQNDVLLVGLGVVIPLNEWLNLVGEVQGRKSTRSTPDTGGLVGVGSRGQARLGVQVFAGGLRWDIAGLAGLTRNDADSGFTFGVSKNVKLFPGFGEIR